MLGDGTRDARRTERYLDGLMTADERRVSEVPADVDLDPAVSFAATQLRAGLTRVHPSFRFEDALAARLAQGAARLRGGLPIEQDEAPVAWGSVAPFRSQSSRSAVGEVPAQVLAPASGPESAHAPAARSHSISPTSAPRRLPERASHPSRPLIVGGVGVASAAISIGAVYVAWRHSHPASGRMGRAARAAHGRAANQGHSRRAGVINGILGVVS
jgi:hypothetical protein